MFGSLGMGEILLVGIVALIVIGPDKLPQVARTLGKSLAELRRVSNELRWQVMSSVEPDESTKTPTTPRPRPKPKLAPAKHLAAADKNDATDETLQVEGNPIGAEPNGEEANSAPKAVHLQKTQADIARSAGIAPESNSAKGPIEKPTTDDTPEESA